MSKASDWQTKREAVRLRAKNACEKCGLKEKWIKQISYLSGIAFKRRHLHIHHLIPEHEGYWVHLYKYGKFGFFDDPLDKLILVCPKCHSKLHHQTKITLKEKLKLLPNKKYANYYPQTI